MEATDNISNADDLVKVSGMMHLLVSEDGLFEKLEDVYRNFTKIHNAAAFQLGGRRSQSTKFHKRRQIGFLITYSRYVLKRIFEKDGITINEVLVDSLSDAEDLLVELVEKSTNKNSERGFLYEMEDILAGIKEAYRRLPQLSEPSPICYKLFSYDLTMEYLDQFIKDLDYLDIDEKHKFMENFIVFRNYLELLNKDQIHGDNWEMLLIAAENLAYKITHYFFIEEECDYISWEYYDERFHDFQSGFRFGVLKALVLQSDGFRGNAPLLSEKLVSGFVKFVQENLLELPRNNKIDQTGAFKDQLKIIHERLSFLMHLLITYPSKHIFEQEKLSNIRLDFQALAWNVGSFICSMLDNPEKEGTSLGLFDLIEKSDVIIGEIIKTICCNVLLKKKQTSPKQDKLGSLIPLLQNLKDFMDRKPAGLTVTWKDHENLVLFVFYLNHYNYTDGNLIGVAHDEFSENTFEFDVAQDELKEVVISAQVFAFNRACYSLLSRYGRFHWWELYFMTEKSVDLHMRVRILEAILLSISARLPDELVIAYWDCIQDSLVELLRNEAFVPLKEQFDILRAGLSFLGRLIVSYTDEQDKVAHIKLGFQDIVRSLGSAVCPCFSDWSRGDTIVVQNTAIFSDLVEKMNLVIDESEELLCLGTISKIARDSPKTNRVGSLNLIIENWKGLMDPESDLISTWKDHFQMIQENLVLFSRFITSGRTEDDESQSLCSCIVDASYVAEYLLTTFSVGLCPVQCRDRWISQFTKQVELIAEDVMKFNEKKGNVNEIINATKDQSQVSAQALLVPTSTDVVVGFEKEMKIIQDQLCSGRIELDVISIVGMPGLGKTTLAKKVYNDPLIKNHFKVRALCCVSQEYNMKELFLTLLGCITVITDEMKKMDETELSKRVFNALKGRRYLIVLDDIWSVDAFMDLLLFFPKDNEESRIMLTSRVKVTGDVGLYGDPIVPDFLTDQDSWDLLERKVYGEGKCPSPQLRQIGHEIAKKCRGLPLAVIVVAGILAKETDNRGFWEQVVENLSSYHDSESHVKIALELSYKHLPDSLKPMFLYLGSFPEDTEIPTDKLVRLWVAEGFVQNTEWASMKLQAERSLIDLVDRSLVMVAKRRSDGRIKSCNIHDLLRDMCLVKAKEENFMRQVNVPRELSAPVMYQRRLSILHKENGETMSRHLDAYKDLPKFSITPPIYSLLFFYMGSDSSEVRTKGFGGLEPVLSSLKLLKILDAGIFPITRDVLDRDLFMLVHLRYLSFCTYLKSIPQSLSRLRSLETLIIKPIRYDFITLPSTIWDMTKLRHLDVDTEYTVKPESSFTLEKLETLTSAYVIVGEEDKLFKKVPGLKILKCNFYVLPNVNWMPPFLNFESLVQLESLTVVNNGSLQLPGQFKILSMLKKLSISNFQLDWSEISIFHELPNLEILKLKRRAVLDGHWDMGDGDVFTKLKFLKLESQHINKWSASSRNFPRLEELVLEKCINLAEIPSDLGDFERLKKIEVKRCKHDIARMVNEIQEEQEEYSKLIEVYIDEIEED